MQILMFCKCDVEEILQWMIKISSSTQKNVSLRKLNFLLLMLTAFGHHLKRLAPLALTLQRIGISVRVLLNECFKDRKDIETIGEGWFTAG